jgi:Lrp/AsnC family leucine-responsive transcriptional regulator
MAINLDLKDRKLLYELDNNSRQSSSKIAKKIHLSPEVVNYRIKRLEKEGIITQYQIIVDLAALGVLQFKIYLSLQHIGSEKLQNILGKIKEIDAIRWIVSCKGDWDFIIGLETYHIEDIDSLKNTIVSLFENHIDTKALSVLVEGQIYNRDYLIDTRDSLLLKRSRVLMKKEREQKIDSLDLLILKKLAENSRKRIVDMAAELKQTPRVIIYRIKQLEKKKIISGYKIAINYEKLGIKFFKTLIYLDNPNKERINTLANYLSQNKNIIHYLKVLGNWDIEIEFEVYSDEEFDSIIKEIKDEFSYIIKRVDTITISKEHKFVYF